MIFLSNYIVTLPRAGLSVTFFFSVFPRGPRTIIEDIRSGYRKGENIEIFSKNEVPLFIYSIFIQWLEQ